MDLVDYAEEPFERVRAELTDFSAKLQVSDIEFIPLSALRGDNVVRPSERMPWYAGATLLYYLEHVSIASDVNMVDLRFPVQYVLRPNLDYRGYAGTIASGVLRRGQDVMVIPSGRSVRVKSIDSAAGEVTEAFAPMAVAVTLDSEVDLSRGDMLVPHNNVPQTSDAFEAMLVWMNDEPLSVGREYLMKIGPVQIAASISDLRYRMNVSTLHREETRELKLNEIGRARVQATRVIAFDPYARNRATGCFILIDRLTNATLAAGMILDRDIAQPGVTTAASVATRVSPDERFARLGQRPFTIWLRGVSRSDDVDALERALFDRGHVTAVIDGNDGARIARILNEAGLIAIVLSNDAPPPAERIVEADDARSVVAMLETRGWLLKR
jgi:bifunctional enzyme CysN/CysC